MPHKKGNNDQSLDVKLDPSKKPAKKLMLNDANDADRAAGQDVNGVLKDNVGCPVVGIGASAGGLAACEAFFKALPAKLSTGFAFVLVQHLSPDHNSILCELIKRYTSMRVQEVKDGMPVEPDCTYIMPPNCDIALIDGLLQLLEPSEKRGLRLPINFFFRSLAHEKKERAICIVLSGTGSDGSLGVRAIKNEGGLVMVQNIESADFDGMPYNAIETGLADYILHPSEMPAQLITYARHAFGNNRPKILQTQASTKNTLKKICVVLRDQSGHDFSQYKTNTLVRRVERRMVINQIESADNYLRYLQKQPTEVENLFRDLLIGVTSFFRDPEIFETLKAEVIPQLFEGKSASETVRIWVCSCSTGEEAYSIAMLLQEYLDELKEAINVQVFATDIDRFAIEKARAGLYPASVKTEITPERLKRFFVQESEEGCYRIQKRIRDMLIFSEQDVLKDPPFSKLDLISCRNLMIYLNGELQKKLIQLFHYGLNSNGTLLLGTSETIGGFTTLFAPVDQVSKIYRKIDSEHVRLPMDKATAYSANRPTHQSAKQKTAGRVHLQYKEITERTLLKHNKQVGVLVSEHGDIIHISGRSGLYLEPAEGEMTANILLMARQGLQRQLTTAFRRAVSSKETQQYLNVKVKTNGDFTNVCLTVQPIEGETRLILVILEQTMATSENTDKGTGLTGKETVEDLSQIALLEQELRTKEEYLQSSYEEMESANEELKSTNEEMQSVNEELQSTNEELETSKEELQSLNEELSTVNAELQTKVINLSQVNNDMNNLLAGTNIGTLFVDLQLRISRFTPTITKIINLISSDIGRPVGDIVSNLTDYSTLVEDLTSVLDTLNHKEIEVTTTNGSPYLMRIQPYRTLENVIEGVVITFVDITEISQLRAIISKGYAKICTEIVATMRQPILVMSEDLMVITANNAFLNFFKVSKSETIDCLFYQLGNNQWDIPELRTLLEEILPKNNKINDYKIRHVFERIGEHTMLVNAQRLSHNTTDDKLILVAFEDIT